MTVRAKQYSCFHLFKFFISTCLCHQGIDGFKLWCWRRLLRVPWIGRRSNQSILKEISPEYSLEGLMLKLKPQYFDHLMRRANSLEKTLMLGKIEGRRRRGRLRMRWLDNITDSMHMNFEQTSGDSEGQRSLACCSPWSRKESDTTLQLNNSKCLHQLHRGMTLGSKEESLCCHPKAVTSSRVIGRPDAATFQLRLAGWAPCKEASAGAGQKSLQISRFKGKKLFSRTVWSVLPRGPCQRGAGQPERSKSPLAIQADLWPFIWLPSNST